ncbi:uncharacterized protein [Penaeus vannamei]|uniref:uncharacterized protein n=1 Tax=Penaeus vannamei TaxID=6689 RepID=UPI00387F56C9
MFGARYSQEVLVSTARISDSLDSNQPRERAGFRSGFSTIDHIYTLIQLREKINKYKKPLSSFEEIFKIEWNRKGIKIGDEYLNNLRFADDIALFNESTNEIQKLINDLNRENLKFGLDEKDKTKVMFNNRV